MYSILDLSIYLPFYLLLFLSLSYLFVLSSKQVRWAVPVKQGTNMYSRLNLSIYLSIYLSTFLSINISISIASIYVLSSKQVRRAVQVQQGAIFQYVFITWSIYLYIYLHLSIYYLSTYLSTFYLSQQVRWAVPVKQGTNMYSRLDISVYLSIYLLLMIARCPLANFPFCYCRFLPLNILIPVERRMKKEQSYPFSPPFSFGLYLWLNVLFYL